MLKSIIAIFASVIALQTFAGTIVWEYSGAIDSRTEANKSVVFPTILAGGQFSGTITIDFGPASTDPYQVVAYSLNVGGYTILGAAERHISNSETADSVSFIELTNHIMDVVNPAISDDVVFRFSDTTGDTLHSDNWGAADLSQFTTKQLIFDGYMWGPWPDSSLLDFDGTIDSMRIVSRSESVAENGPTLLPLALAFCSVIYARKRKSLNSTLESRQ